MKIKHCSKCMLPVSKRPFDGVVFEYTFDVNSLLLPLNTVFTLHKMNFNKTCTVTE